MHILCSGFSPRSLEELSAEHWQTTLRFCASRLILEDIPVLGQHTVGDPYDVSGDPVPRASHSREPSVDYDKVAVGHDHARLVFERRGSTLDEVEETFATRLGRYAGRSSTTRSVQRPCSLAC